MDDGLRRRALRVVVALTLLAAGGFALLAVSEDTAVEVAGFMLVGIAGVAVVAWVFFEVGRSEDAERARAGDGGATGGDGDGRGGPA